jgi:hypothetical protein
MGIKLDYNLSLTLRSFGTEGREPSECLPAKLEAGKVYEFLKKGQRNYWMTDEIPLFEINGDRDPLRPVAFVSILETTHFSFDGEVLTRGKYRVSNISGQNAPRIKLGWFSVE